MSRYGRCSSFNPAECDTGKRVKPIHVFTGLVLPFWADLNRLFKESIKVIRVQPTDGGERLVGIRVLNADKVAEVSNIFRRGVRIQQAEVSEKISNLVQNPFYEVLQTLVYHECLNLAGKDAISFELPAGWRQASPVTPVMLCVAQRRAYVSKFNLVFIKAFYNR